jgi:hypothetical protein
MRLSGRTGTIIVAILVIAIIVVLYLSLVGYVVASSDIGADEDPTGADREPISYIVVDIHAMVKNVIGGFSGTVTNTVVVYPYVGEMSVYDTSRWGILGFLEDDIVVYVVTTISGPGNYYTQWTSEKIEDSIPELYIGEGDEHEYDFGPYTAKFYDEGSYTLTTSLWVEWDEEWSDAHKIAQDSDLFTVNS